MILNVIWNIYLNPILPPPPACSMIQLLNAATLDNHQWQYLLHALFSANLVYMPGLLILAHLWPLEMTPICTALPPVTLHRGPPESPWHPSRPPRITGSRVRSGLSSLLTAPESSRVASGLGSLNTMSSSMTGLTTLAAQISVSGSNFSNSSQSSWASSEFRNHL